MPRKSVNESTRSQGKPARGAKIRVGAGRLKGRLISCPDTGGVRPMLSRTRDALFQVLADDVRDAVIWDCFAGSGALGIEALSRGARHCVFIEADRRHARIVRENLDSLDLQGASTLIGGSIFDVAKPGTAPLPNSPAGIVLLDPPHAMVEDEDSPFWSWMARLHETFLLHGYTIVCLGHPAALETPDEIGALTLADRRLYGTVGFSIYVRVEPPDEEG